MAASLRAAATRTLRPAVHRPIFHTHHQQLPKSTRAYRAVSEYHASLIQERKEQLYDLIARADANSRTFLLNKRLLKDLSTQVTPRPYDPQWRKISRTKKVTDVTTAAVTLVVSGLTYYALVSRPEILRYGDYLVTAESVPLIRQRLEGQIIQERLRRVATAEALKNKQDGHQPVATAEGVNKQDECQPVATAEAVNKQDERQPVATAEAVNKQHGHQPVATSEGVNKQDECQPVATAEGVNKQDERQPVATAEGVNKQDEREPVATAEGVNKQDECQPVATAEGVDKQ